MPHQMTQQTWTLVMDGNTLLLIGNNNTNDNANNHTNNSVLDFTPINPLPCSMEEEALAEPSNICLQELNPHMNGECVDLPQIDFSALTSHVDEKEENVHIPTTVTEMSPEEESLFQDEPACAAVSGRDTSAGVSLDLAALLGSSSGVADPLLSTSSLDLLLHTPTTPIPWQLSPTTPAPTTSTSPQGLTSVSSATSFPFLSVSADSYGTTTTSAVTLPPVPVSPSSSYQTTSSPNMTLRTASTSTLDDVSSSSSGDVSGSEFDDVTSFSDVIMSGIDGSTSPGDFTTLETDDPTIPGHARAPSLENLTSLSDAVDPETRVVASGNGTQCLLLLPPEPGVPDKMAAEEEMAAEAAEVLETCSLTPLIKEELKYTIQSRRLAAGKEELPLEVSGTRICRRRYAREKRQLTAEERERDGKRREQNRQAAQRFRQKQRDTENILSKKCRKLEGSNSSLQAEIQRLAREVQQLQHMMDSHLPSCCKSAN